MSKLIGPSITITCARCNRPVEEVIRHKLDNFKGYKFTVKCHGEIETCEISREFFQAISPENMTAKAFLPKPGIEHKP